MFAAWDAAEAAVLGAPSRGAILRIEMPLRPFTDPPTRELPPARDDVIALTGVLPLAGGAR